MSYTAAIVSPRTKLARELRQHLQDPAFAIETSLYSSARRFEESFHGGLERAYAEPHFTLGNHVGARPNVLIVDLGTPDAIEQRVLVARILQANPRHEILVLVNHLATRRIGYLLCGAAGNILSNLSPESLCLQAKRLASIGVVRSEYQRKKRLGIAPPLAIPPRKVFLSHSSEQEALGYGMRRFIEMHGDRVWFSFTDGNVDPWEPPMNAAVDGARAFVPLLTDDWIRSPICQLELERFENRVGKDRTLKVLPFIAQDSVVSDPLVQKLLHDWRPHAFVGVGAQASWILEQLS